MRTTISTSLLRDRVTLRRQSVVDVSSTGVKKQEWADVAANVPASIQAISVRVLVVEGGEKDQASYMGYFLPELDLRVGDEIVRVNAEQGGTERLLVTYVEDARGHHLEAELRTNEE